MGIFLSPLLPTVTPSMCCVSVRYNILFIVQAIISAIAGVDNISLNKAEEKYLNGRCISER